MQGVVQNKGAMMAVKAGVAAGTIFLAERMWKRGNRVGAIATMLVANGVTAHGRGQQLQGRAEPPVSGSDDFDLAGWPSCVRRGRSHTRPRLS